jgi:hypothetical protein
MLTNYATEVGPLARYDIHFDSGCSHSPGMGITNEFRLKHGNLSNLLKEESYVENCVS